MATAGAAPGPVMLLHAGCLAWPCGSQGLAGIRSLPGASSSMLCRDTGWASRVKRTTGTPSAACMCRQSHVRGVSQEQKCLLPASFSVTCALSCLQKDHQVLNTCLDEEGGWPPQSRANKAPKKCSQQRCPTVGKRYRTANHSVFWAGGATSSMKGPAGRSTLSRRDLATTP